MKYFSVLLLIITLFSCKANSEANTPSKHSLQLVKLGDPVEENAKSKNIAGYKIEKNIKLSKTQQADFLKEINNPENLEKIVRRCAFEPSYALVANNQVIAIFDVEYCPKIQLVQQNDGKILDLKQNNALKELILNITKK